MVLNFKNTLLVSSASGMKSSEEVKPKLGPSFRRKLKTHGFFPCSKYIATVPFPIFKEIKRVAALMLRTEIVK
jgi:hypothetical protein